MEYSIPRHYKVPKQSFFLFDPRGTGKSTLLTAKRDIELAKKRFTELMRGAR